MDFILNSIAFNYSMLKESNSGVIGEKNYM